MRCSSADLECGGHVNLEEKGIADDGWIVNERPFGAEFVSSASIWRMVSYERWVGWQVCCDFDDALSGSRDTQCMIMSWLRLPLHLAQSGEDIYITVAVMSTSPSGSAVGLRNEGRNHPTVLCEDWWEDKGIGITRLSTGTRLTALEKKSRKASSARVMSPVKVSSITHPAHGLLIGAPSPDPISRDACKRGPSPLLPARSAYVFHNDIAGVMLHLLK
uniref:DUF1618 domain-containing protein n=1 Tax=Ascaris lumbricoides TaxID=6252 RepID=A0A0M3I0K7_ASCLU